MDKRRLAVILALAALIAVTLGIWLRLAPPRAVLAQQSSGATLRDIAKGNGGKASIVIQPDRSIIHLDLVDLAKASDVVVVAQIEGNRCVVSSDERSVTTDYNVTIAEAIKGDVRQGSATVVGVPGGLALFEDEHALPIAERTQAHVLLRGFIKPKNGATYVLFLRRESVPGRFEITGGPQGAFDVSTSAVVAADMVTTDPLVHNHDKMSSTVFLQLVRAACAGH